MLKSGIEIQVLRCWGDKAGVRNMTQLVGEALNLIFGTMNLLPTLGMAQGNMLQGALDFYLKQQKQF